MKRFRLGLGVVTLLGFFASAHADSLLTNHSTVVACADCDVPGMPPFTTFGSSVTNPVMAEDGTVLFVSNLAGPTITTANSRALFYGSAYANVFSLAQWSDPAPGLPGLRLINNGGSSGIGTDARLSPDGRTFWWSKLTNDTNDLPANSDTALFAGFPGSVAVVAREGSPAPGTAGAAFGDFASFSIQFSGMNRNGTVMFQSPLVGGDVVGTTNDVALYTGTVGALTIAVRRGDTLLPGPVKAAAFSGQIQLDDSGRILYGLQLSGPGVTTANDSSIWLYTPGSGNTLVLREGDAAPGTTGAFFSGALSTAANYFSSGGRYEVLTSLIGGDAVGGVNDSALYIGTPGGALTLLARKGDPAPGTDGLFSGFNPFFSYVNGAGVATFQASLSGGTVTSSNDSGMWVGTPGSLTLVLREGTTVIPGSDGSTCGGVISNFAAFSNYGFVQVCSLTGPFTVPAVNTSAVVAWSPAQGLFLVARAGESLEFLPGNFRTETGFGLFGSNDSNGAALGLSHAGKLAVRPSLDPGLAVVTLDLTCAPATDYYLDADGDGHGDPTTEINLCVGGVPPSGYITTSGDCLDGDPGALGASTEVCNGLDDDCDARIDEQVPRPTGTLTMTLGKSGGNTVLSWAAMPGATAYDIVSGNLAELRGAGGHYQFLNSGVCAINDLPDTSYTTFNNPNPGQGTWYVMRASNCGGNGSYDEGVPAQHSTRDAEIGPSLYSCP